MHSTHSLLEDRDSESKPTCNCCPTDILDSLAAAQLCPPWVWVGGKWLGGSLGTNVYVQLCKTFSNQPQATQARTNWLVTVVSGNETLQMQKVKALQQLQIRL